MTSRQVPLAVVALLGVALLAYPIEVRTRPDPDVALPPDGAAQRPDADGAGRSQVLQILTTNDDGEISGGKLLFSGEPLWGNLIHAGSWATAPTISHAFPNGRSRCAAFAG